MSSNTTSPDSTNTAANNSTSANNNTQQANSPTLLSGNFTSTPLGSTVSLNWNRPSFRPFRTLAMTSDLRIITFDPTSGSNSGAQSANNGGTGSNQ
ncbi:hypothetical protein JCM3765_005315 [Sporobolomyces pararoseus]